MNPPIFTTIALVLLPLSQAISQTPAPPEIRVSGTAEVKVAPDEIHLSVGVETRHETMEDAKRQNDERMARALAFIQRSGVPGKDVQTDFISVEPTYERQESLTKPTYYLVRKSIGIRVTKIAGFESFLTGLLTNGVTTVHGVDFRNTQMRQHRDTARAMAIRAAREKADAMAAELGVKRGKVLSISADDQSGWWGSSGGYWGRRAFNAYQNAAVVGGESSAPPDSTLSMGVIGVSASVTVSFRIE